MYLKEMNNLSEYLLCVNSLLEKNKLFFRGESVKYEKRVASLLDITSSPLVALYFCVMNNMDNDGFIYTYDSVYSIDISNQLRGYDIEDLVDEFIYLSNPDFLATIFNGLIDLKNNKFEFFYLIQESLVNEILRLKEYECIYVDQLPNFNTIDFIHVLTKPNKFILSSYLSDFDEIMKKQDKIKAL